MKDDRRLYDRIKGRLRNWFTGVSGRKPGAPDLMIPMAPADPRGRAFPIIIRRKSRLSRKNQKRRKVLMTMQRESRRLNRA